MSDARADRKADPRDAVREQLRKSGGKFSVLTLLENSDVRRRWD